MIKSQSIEVDKYGFGIKSFPVELVIDYQDGSSFYMIGWMDSNGFCYCSLFNVKDNMLIVKYALDQIDKNEVGNGLM